MIKPTSILATALLCAISFASAAASTPAGVVDSDGSVKSRAASKASKPSRPNIVLIVADDLGWADLKCYGGDLMETPRIDRLAQQGVRFTDAYAAAPVCTPTRASIMTGKCPARLHMTTWSEDAADPNVNKARNAKLSPAVSEPNLPLDEVTLAERLKKLGYGTAHVGKWHLGDKEHYPNLQGFDTCIGGTFRGCPHSFFPPFLDGDKSPMTNLQPGNKGDYLTDRLTDEAIKIIDRQKDDPFFLYLAYYTVHTPIEGKPEMVERCQERIKPGMLHQNADYAAMVESLDENVGRVLDKLDSAGLADNTVVIFFSDNGGAHYRHNKQIITNNHPLREGKGTLYEGGVRVPMIIRWPGVSKAGAVSSVPVVSTDLYPTILGMVLPDSAPLQDAPFDGVDLTPLLKGKAEKLDRDELCFHFPHYYYGMNTPVSSIRMGNWKLLEYIEDGRVELYDLQNDIGEKKNLAQAHPEKAEKLRRKLHDWRRQVGARMPKPIP